MKLRGHGDDILLDDFNFNFWERYKSLLLGRVEEASWAEVFEQLQPATTPSFGLNLPPSAFATGGL